LETTVYEIAPEVYRLSTFIPEAGLVFNQFLIDDEEPLLFHTGMKAIFPLVLSAVERVMDPLRLRWITFGHYEADECGAMNSWLAAAPNAVVAHGTIGVMTSIRDQADRAPRALSDGETIELGSKRVRYHATPHVPHGWDAGLLYELTTKTLFAGDLFTQLGDGPEVTFSDIVGPAFEAEDSFRATALTPATELTIRFLSGLDIDTLALMHAPAYRGDASQALAELANGYAERYAMSGGR
jgi:flavorubredoxin